MRTSQYLIIGILVMSFLVTITCTKKHADQASKTEIETVTDIDGNVYHTVTIGKQIWTVENLRTTKLNDGTPIPQARDSIAWGRFNTSAYCYNNEMSEYRQTDLENIKKFGALYNWYAVNTLKLAPKGWHVPNDAEWDTLQNYLTTNGYNWDGTTKENKIAKALAARTDWAFSKDSGAIGNDLTKNNRSGFSALPGGSRNYGGHGFSDGKFIVWYSFWPIGDKGGWWSASEGDREGVAHTIILDESSTATRSSFNSAQKNTGLSVRLLKDYVENHKDIEKVVQKVSQVPQETTENKTPAPEGMVWIPGGRFMMGSENGNTNERPVHTVTVSGFYMDKTEVTREGYKKVMGKIPMQFDKYISRLRPGIILRSCPACPVENVSWEEATAYCKKVGKRLPTEAEWEYACRAGSTTKYYWGNEFDGDYAWYGGGENADNKNITNPVGQKKPNAYGLFDMNGVLSEWCSDWYEIYSGGPAINPVGPTTGTGHVTRGGLGDNPHNYTAGSSKRDFRDDFHSADRDNGPADLLLSGVGFRCVLSMK